MEILNPSAVGLQSSGPDLLDLATAPVIRQRIPAVDRSMSKQQAEMYLKSDVPVPGVATTTYAPAAPAPAPLAPAAPAAPAYNPAGAPAPATPAAAPTSPTYSERANERIARLYGERESEREYGARLEAALAEQNKRLDALLLREQSRQAAPPNQSNFYDPGAQIGTPPAAGQFVSRQEMQTLLDNQAQAIASAFHSARQQDASRIAAEADFPEVASDPTARALADRIWKSEPALQRDPQGPYKAALMARGLLADPTSATARAVTDARKSALAGVGVSVADGTGTTDERESRYQAALAHAKSTQRIEDFVSADLIARGLK